MKKQVATTAFFSFLLTAVLIFFDQITKVWATKALADGPFVIISGAFELQYLENQGAAFGMLQGARTFFLILTPVFVILACWFMMKLPSVRHYLGLRLCLILLIAGALGNFIDRLFLHYVRDFFYISLINFPIFNVADMYVTFGVIFLIILILFVFKDGEISVLLKKKSKEGENIKHE